MNQYIQMLLAVVAWCAFANGGTVCDRGSAVTTFQLNRGVIEVGCESRMAPECVIRETCRWLRIYRGKTRCDALGFGYFVRGVRNSTESIPGQRFQFSHILCCKAANARLTACRLLMMDRLETPFTIQPTRVLRSLDDKTAKVCVLEHAYPHRHRGNYSLGCSPSSQETQSQPRKSELQRRVDYQRQQQTQFDEGVKRRVALIHQHSQLQVDAAAVAAAAIAPGLGVGLGAGIPAAILTAVAVQSQTAASTCTPTTVGNCGNIDGNNDQFSIGFVLPPGVSVTYTPNEAEHCEGATAKVGPCDTKLYLGGGCGQWWTNPAEATLTCKNGDWYYYTTGPYSEECLAQKLTCE